MGSAVLLVMLSAREARDSALTTGASPTAYMQQYTSSRHTQLFFFCLRFNAHPCSWAALSHIFSNWQACAKQCARIGAEHIQCPLVTFRVYSPVSHLYVVPQHCLCMLVGVNEGHQQGQVGQLLLVHASLD
jgi:hypothetical protein